MLEFVVKRFNYFILQMIKTRSSRVNDVAQYVRYVTLASHVD